VPSLGELGERASSGDVLFEGTRSTAAELSDRAARVVGGLVELGVRPGDRVAVCSLNTPDVLVLYDAVWRAGAVATPVVPAASEAELRHVLDEAAPSLLVTSPERAATVSGLSVLTELPLGPPLRAVATEGSDPAALLFTGGTTGRAKGVVLTHDNLWHTGWARQSVLDGSGVRSMLVPLPLSHVYGLLNAVCRMHQASPVPLLLQRRFDAVEWLALVREHSVEAGALVPSMLQLLLAHDLDGLDSLRYLTCGGAPLAPAVVHEFQRRVPSVVVCDGYGCTEVTSTATMNPPDAPRVGTVGLPIPGVEIRIDEASGEVLVRSPGVMAGYWRDPVATAEAVDPDGWMRTGDVGQLDDDGYLTVVDRLKDLVIRGGFNVYPRDVEDVLLQHPAVASAAVVGRPDPVLGEEVVAFVSLRPGLTATPAELVAFGAERLGRHKHPREVRIVDVVPLTPVGKTDRKQLRALVRDAGGRQPES
jgi:long-chain acyl-CoA synthetase